MKSKGDSMDKFTDSANERICLGDTVLFDEPMQIGATGVVRYRDWETDRKSTRLNSSHSAKSRMPSSA